MSTLKFAGNPDFRAQFPGPMTSIDPDTVASTETIQNQFPQNEIAWNGQHTLVGYFSQTDPAAVGIWAPLALGDNPFAGRFVVSADCPCIIRTNVEPPISMEPMPNLIIPPTTGLIGVPDPISLAPPSPVPEPNSLTLMCSVVLIAAIRFCCRNRQ